MTAVFATWRHRVVIELKRAFYRGRRKPYRIEGTRYLREVLVKDFSPNPSIKRPTVEMCACSDGIGEAILFTRGGNS
jgi:hypothetical protein